MDVVNKTLTRLKRERLKETKLKTPKHANKIQPTTHTKKTSKSTRMELICQDYHTT